MKVCPQPSRPKRQQERALEQHNKNVCPWPQQLNREKRGTHTQSRREYLCALTHIVRGRQVSDEFKQVISTLKGHDDKVRVVLNKADQVDMQQLMRVYGALMWSLGKVFRSPEARPAARALACVGSGQRRGAVTHDESFTARVDFSTCRHSAKVKRALHVSRALVQVCRGHRLIQSRRVVGAWTRAPNKL